MRTNLEKERRRKRRFWDGSKERTILSLSAWKGHKRRRSDELESPGRGGRSGRHSIPNTEHARMRYFVRDLQKNVGLVDIGGLRLVAGVSVAAGGVHGAAAAALVGLGLLAVQGAGDGRVSRREAFGREGGRGHRRQRGDRAGDCQGSRGEGGHCRHNREEQAEGERSSGTTVPCTVHACTQYPPQ